MSGDGIGVTRGRPYRLVQLRAGAADATRRGCADCAHLVGYVNWWCGNKGAAAVNGTSLPGRVGCDFWEAPREARKSVQARTAGGGWWARLTRALLILTLLALPRDPRPEPFPRVPTVEVYE